MKPIKLSILLSVILFTISSCKQNYVEQEVQEKEKIQQVEVQTLTINEMPIPIEASGIVSSKMEVNLSFKVGGIIDRLYAEEGQTVRKGQTLAILKTTEIDAQVLKANQGVEKAKRDVERIEKLYADTAATLENVQDLKTLLELAEADLEIATFNQEYAKIKAPSSGRILRKFTEANELINPGTPVFRLGATGAKGFVIKVGVADKDIIRLRLKDKAELRFDAYPDDVFEAYISEIAEAADPRTGVFEIELSITQQPGYILKNGFIGKLSIFPSSQKPYFKIDMDALVEGNKNKASIYVPNNNDTNARKVVVRPEYIGDDFFTISADKLENIERVITKGAAYLSETTTIKVIDSTKEN